MWHAVWLGLGASRASRGICAFPLGLGASRAAVVAPFSSGLGPAERLMFRLSVRAWGQQGIAFGWVAFGWRSRSQLRWLKCQTPATDARSMIRCAVVVVFAVVAASSMDDNDDPLLFLISLGDATRYILV